MSSEETKTQNNKKGIEQKSHPEEIGAIGGCLAKVVSWFKKYFCEGQALHEGAEVHDSTNKLWYIRYRKFLGMGIPFLFYQIIWWSLIITNNQFFVFTERVGDKDIPRWYMAVTMIFGSLIAGGSSEGGGSVAFPVMTLLFGIEPKVARDFSFLVQSTGMTAASFTINWMKVKTEKNSIKFCSLGGVFGIILGLEKIAPSLEPSQSKMYFVVIWFAFAFSLYWLNRLHGRKVYDEIPYWEDGIIYQRGNFSLNWKAMVLICFGFLGGIFTGMAGSGLDICSFSCLTLLFRVSEKTATPTSVVLMAINSVIGLMYREFAMDGIEGEAWGFIKAAAPVVILCAPTGSVLFSHFHRLLLASFVYVTDTAQLIGALYIVRPWTHRNSDNPVQLCIASGSIVIAGAIGFTLMAFAGEKLLEKQEGPMDEDIELQKKSKVTGEFQDVEFQDVEFQEKQSI